MAKFRKKPVVIEAVNYTGYTTELPCEFGATIARSELGGSCYIETLEGDMRVDPGDWIIKGAHGEFYPCKPGIFEATYEAV